MKKIYVAEYNPKWKDEFKKAHDFYRNLLSDLDVKIEHVGSTSVEGLMAKPILDIDIVVKNQEDSKEALGLLKAAGYIHIGNLGLEGREAFRYEEDNKNIRWMEHHLYLCLENSENYKNHILLREHLRNNKEAIKRYGELKLELYKKYEYDIEAYIDGKTDLILGFLKEEGMGKAQLDNIEAINKMANDKN